MSSFSVEGLSLVLTQLLPEPHAGLLAGILFGTKVSLSSDLYQALVRTGTLHIVALSGMNITIIANLFAKGLLWLVSRRVASLITVAGVIWFVWFVGASPSIVRAAIMGSLSLIAVILGRQYWALFTWVLAVSIMLVLNFSWLFELSFQLSALASLGIILFGSADASVGSPFAALRKDSGQAHGVYPEQSEGLEKVRRPALYLTLDSGNKYIKVMQFLWSFIHANLRLTLAAQVFTIPLIFFHFHRISLISPLTNLLIGWTVPMVTGIGWVAAGVGYIFIPLGQIAAWVAWVLLQYLITVVELTNRVPLASMGW